MSFIQKYKNDAHKQRCGIGIGFNGVSTFLLARLFDKKITKTNYKPPV